MGFKILENAMKWKQAAAALEGKTQFKKYIFFNIFRIYFLLSFF